jgi:hypothetical protein
MKNGLIAVLSTMFFVPFLMVTTVYAHCDTLNGPVVMAAKQALENGDVNLVLIWVKPKDEAEIRAAFDESRAVRKQSKEARELADKYFFETLIRIHRAGEGFPYTGLKPAGMDLGPVIPAADAAVESGQLEGVHKLLMETMRDGIQHRFQKVLKTKNYKPNDVIAGREFVEAYVVFLHYVEGIYGAIAKGVHGQEGAKTQTGRHEE